jgi:hypothetical protein
MKKKQAPPKKQAPWMSRKTTPIQPGDIVEYRGITARVAWVSDDFNKPKDEQTTYTLSIYEVKRKDFTLITKKEDVDA